jgi:hypothetical protein
LGGLRTTQVSQRVLAQTKQGKKNREKRRTKELCGVAGINMMVGECMKIGMKKIIEKKECP